MEPGQIVVCTNHQNWLKNLQRTRTKLLSVVQRVTSMGISIVSFWNESFPTFCLCLTTGCHLGFTEKLRNSRSRQLFVNSSWGNAVTAFSLSSQFHVAAVSDISYIWVAKLWTSNIRFGYCAILTVTQICVRSWANDLLLPPENIQLLYTHTAIIPLLYTPSDRV